MGGCRNSYLCAGVAAPPERASLRWGEGRKGGGPAPGSLCSSSDASKTGGCYFCNGVMPPENAGAEAAQASKRRLCWLPVAGRPHGPPRAGQVHGCWGVGASVGGMNDRGAWGLTRLTWEDMCYNLASVRWGDMPRRFWKLWLRTRTGLSTWRLPARRGRGHDIIANPDI